MGIKQNDPTYVLDPNYVMTSDADKKAIDFAVATGVDTTGGSLASPFARDAMRNIGADAYQLPEIKISNSFGPLSSGAAGGDASALKGAVVGFAGPVIAGAVLVGMLMHSVVPALEGNPFTLLTPLDGLLAVATSSATWAATYLFCKRRKQSPKESFLVASGLAAVVLGGWVAVAMHPYDLVRDKHGTRYVKKDNGKVYTTRYGGMEPWKNSLDLGAVLLKDLRDVVVGIPGQQEKYSVSARTLIKGNFACTKSLLTNATCIVPRDKLIPVVGHTALALVKGAEKEHDGKQAYYILKRGFIDIGGFAPGRVQRKLKPEELTVGHVWENFNPSLPDANHNTTFSYIVPRQHAIPLNAESEYELVLFKERELAPNETYAYALVKKKDILKPEATEGLQKVVFENTVFFVPRSKLQPLNADLTPKKKGFWELFSSSKNKRTPLSGKALASAAKRPGAEGGPLYVSRAWRPQCRV